MTEERLQCISVSLATPLLTLNSGGLETLRVTEHHLKSKPDYPVTAPLQHLMWQIHLPVSLMNSQTITVAVSP